MNKLNAVLDSGAAAQRFAPMVSELGGPGDLDEAPVHHLGHTPIVFPVAASHEGFVERIECRALGLVVVGLGGGRRRPEVQAAYSFAATVSPVPPGVYRLID